MNIYVQESYVNASEGYGMGGSDDPYEAFTDDVGELYRFCVRENGRCIGKVYIDTEDGSRAIGWVFHKRDRYEDTGESYLRETWVTLHDAPSEHRVIRHYRYLKG